jgi:pimeloyl-ACP methyl ester carboxylesterase
MQTGFVHAGQVRLQYFEHGSGPEVIVFVHGYTASGRIWRLTQEALDPARFHTIAISNRGAGDSDRTPSEADYEIESFARDLLAAVQELHVGDFTLVGHSMGGATVTQFALDHPEQIKALVLLDPAPLIGRGLPEGWEEQVRERFRNNSATADPQTNNVNPSDDFNQARRADVARNPIERLLGGRRSMAGLRLRNRLAELAMPVLVVGGDRDSTVGIDNILAEYLALSPEYRSSIFSMALVILRTLRFPRS